METHPIHSLMKTSLENLKGMIDVDTIIGEKVIGDDGTIIIPVSRVRFGYGVGGSEFTSQNKEIQELPFGGGSSGGVSITPIGFLVVRDGNVDILHMQDDIHIYEKLIDLAPKLIAKFLKRDVNENEAL